MSRELKEGRGKTFSSSRGRPRTRRSQRLPLRVPVRIECSFQDRGHLFYDAFTTMINAHGALLELPWEVSLGVELTIENLATRERQIGKVAYVAVAENGKFDVGVDFSRANPKFWGVSFPPDDWTLGHPDAKTTDLSNSSVKITTPERQAKRHVPLYRDLSITYEGSSEAVSIRPPDLSVQGMFIPTFHHFPEGAILKIKFKLARSLREINARGEVRYFLPGVGIGIEFVEMSPEGRKAIQEELRVLESPGSRK